MVVCSAAMILVIAVGQAQAPTAMTLRSVGNGEKVKIAANGKAKITKNKVSLAFDEGRKKYVLTFDISEADKGLQLKGS